MNSNSIKTLSDLRRKLVSEYDNVTDRVEYLKSTCIFLFRLCTELKVQSASYPDRCSEMANQVYVLSLESRDALERWDHSIGREVRESERQNVERHWIDLLDALEKFQKKCSWQGFAQWYRERVPEPASSSEADRREFGPDFLWQGPGEAKLQSLFSGLPAFLDVGFLVRVLGKAESVCKVEVGKCDSSGTGFVIAPGYVLTSYHLIDGLDPDTAAASITLKFGRVTLQDGKEAGGDTFSLASSNPVPCSSPTSELDFLLLRGEERFVMKGLDPLLLAAAPPPPGSGLHIIQHPAGDVMKLAISENAVTDIENGIFIHYITKTLMDRVARPVLMTT